MENKELEELRSANSLSELFEAKRTVEANRRRQEELHKMLSATAAPKSRRLWPVWALSAAACIALMLITLPSLFRSKSATPLLVAETTEIPAPKEEPDTNTTRETRITSKTRNTRTTRTATTLLASAEPEEILQEEPQKESLLAQEPLPTPPIPEETPEEVPRIHHSTSTQMVCSNCSINNVPSPSTALQEFLAASFGTATNTPLTLKTIEF